MRRLLERLRSLEEHYYNDFGWYVQKNGETIAELTDAHQFEMFWTSYTVVPRTTDPVILRLLRNDLFWADLRYRSRKFQDYCFHTLARCDFTGSVILRSPPRLAESPSFVETILLFIRQLLGCNCKTVGGKSSEPVKRIDELGFGPEIYADIQRMYPAFCELEMLGFRYDPNFGSEDWVPQSTECSELFKRIIAPENRARLQRWYGLLAETGYIPPGADLKKHIEMTIGQSL